MCPRNDCRFSDAGVGGINGKRLFHALSILFAELQVVVVVVAVHGGIVQIQSPHGFLKRRSSLSSASASFSERAYATYGVLCLQAHPFLRLDFSSMAR